MVYIGQARGPSLQTRWNKHKNDAKKFPHNESLKKHDGKAAKLYAAMNLFDISEMKIEELEFYEYADKNELINKLRLRENHFIDQFDSINYGWNKIKAPAATLLLGQDEEETWETRASKHNVNQRSLHYQVTKHRLSIEEAVKKIRKLKKEPKRQYSYGRQTYDVSSDLLIYDKNNIGKKNIERRIRNLKNQKKLRVDLDKSKNLETIYLIEDVFSPLSQTDKIVKVNTPHGQEVGAITDLHEKLLPLYPDNVPDSYSTIQNRVDGKNFKVKWNHDQAFGFRFPPGFEKVENLIENKGYQWGEIDGVQKNPSFKKDSKRITNPNPIILHSVKRIYLTEKDWCDAYKLNDRKKIKKLRDKGRTNEEILEYCGKKP